MSKPYRLYPLAPQVHVRRRMYENAELHSLAHQVAVWGRMSGPADQIVGDLVCYPGSLHVPQAIQGILVVA
ncbi:hypothetical protein SLA2020_271060 [Shorea laevis]